MCVTNNSVLRFLFLIRTICKQRFVQIYIYVTFENYTKYRALILANRNVCVFILTNCVLHLCNLAVWRLQIKLLNY